MTDVQKYLLSIDPFWLGAVAVALMAYLLRSMCPVARRLERASRRFDDSQILNDIGDGDCLFASDPVRPG